ncbi:hypothetical protein, partial [Klebsiella pneumoniae]|uniref:hypothetical protein n=1 Tax=Klebsiella pneumoniae TaxID=573 RepID=UPI0022B07325
WLMMSLWDALRMNMMISYQELVRTFPNKNNNELNECHIPILHSGFNGSARTFSGTLNCGFVTARNLFLKSNTRPGEINVHSGSYYVMRFSGSDIRGGI